MGWLSSQTLESSFLLWNTTCPNQWTNDVTCSCQNHPCLSKKGFGSFKYFSSVQSLSCVWLFATPWIAAYQASLSITNSRSLLKLMSIESVMPSNHLILCRPLLLLPTIPPSIRVFSNESTLRMRWPKYWSFCFSIGPSNEQYLGFKKSALNLLPLLILFFFLLVISVYCSSLGAFILLEKSHYWQHPISNMVE